MSDDVKSVRRSNWMIYGCVFATLLVWETRHLWNVSTPMYGWPISCHNLWYLGRSESRWQLWIVDLAIWWLLARATADVLGKLRRHGLRFQFRIADLLLLQGVVAGLIALALTESHFRDNDMFPRYVLVAIGELRLAFDVGLFTDRPDRWLGIRAVVIFFIGCAICSALTLVVEQGRRLMSAIGSLRRRK